MTTRRLTIAIDGPASSGKGTVARSVARDLGYAYVDTGAMFRTVALLAAEAGVDWADGPALGRLAEQVDFRFRWQDGELRVAAGERDVSEEIRTDLAGRGASAVSVHPPVRAALLERQRSLARQGGIVMDGRDIGTVVLPDADLKIYLDATPQERARRRHREFAERGIALDYDTVLAEIVERDHRDSTRAEAPLKAAPDALVVDSTELSAQEVARLVLDAVGARLDGHSPRA